MRLRLIIIFFITFLFVFLLILSNVGKNSVTNTVTTNTVSTSPISWPREVFERINAYRKQNSFSQLQYDVMLENISKNHSLDMKNKNYVSHTNSSGESPSDRLNKANYLWRSNGEIIAAGYKNPESVVKGWINSPLHKNIILTNSFTKTGVGFVVNETTGIPYWTQMFAS
jgi:uncharacterized protein YkwD